MGLAGLTWLGTRGQRKRLVRLLRVSVCRLARRLHYCSVSGIGISAHPKGWQKVVGMYIRDIFFLSFSFSTWRLLDVLVSLDMRQDVFGVSEVWNPKREPFIGVL